MAPTSWTPSRGGTGLVMHGDGANLRGLPAVRRRVQSPDDALLALRIVAFALAVPLLTRLPLRHLDALLRWGPRKRRATPTEVQKTVAFAGAVLRRGRPLARGDCLPRGLTLYYFLRRAGLDVSLHFGVMADAGVDRAPIGHCWLVKGGEPFLETRDPRPLYVELYHLPWEGDGRR
jgi:hypothetical protein